MTQNEKVGYLHGSNPKLMSHPPAHPSALPEDVIKLAKDIKPVTEIQQNGNDFVITSKTPGKSITNSFTIGKEADITTMDGKKLKVSNPNLPDCGESIHMKVLIDSLTYC